MTEALLGRPRGHNLLYVPSGIAIESSGFVLAERARWARSWRERARGLKATGPLEAGDALVIEPAKQIHTFGLAYSIDVVFCSRDWRVVHIVRSLKPRRVTRLVVGARYAIELPAASVPTELVTGDRLTISRGE